LRILECMSDKDLIAKLNKLKTITPDLGWKVSNRELLLSQISNSGAHELSAWEVFVINLGSLAKAITRPVYALGVFALVLISGSLFSHQIFKDAKPNDSLYIARIISEQARINTVINPEERNKLAVQFATERAKEISTVLANPEFNNEANQDQVAKLNTSLNQEINNVKSRISYLNVKKDSEKNTEDGTVLATGTDIVTIASELKDEAGIELLNKTEENEPALNVIATTSPVKATSDLEEGVASLTEVASSTEVVNSLSGPDVAIEEVEKLLENKNYNEAANKLKEIGEMIK